MPNLTNKEQRPTIIYVGRLKKAEAPDHAVYAFNLIQQVIPNAQMWIVGDGYMYNKILNISKNSDIKIFGKISEDQEKSIAE